MDDNSNNYLKNNVSGTGDVPKVDLPSSHPATIPLPSSMPAVSKPAEAVTPLSDATKEVPVTAVKPPIPEASTSVPTKPVIPPEVKTEPPLVSNMPIKEEDMQPPVLPVAPSQMEPELSIKEEPVVVVKKEPVIVPPIVEKQPEPILISGPHKRGKGFKVLFRYLSLILGGFLLIGIVLAGYVFIKDMAEPEGAPVVKPPVTEEIIQEEKPKPDNTSLDALDNYFGNVDRELRILEDKTSFESVMNLSGTELR